MTGRSERRDPWRDGAILALLCFFAYTVGLTTHGLTNWQEARRAVVGKEMFEKGEWIVPTYFGEPYIAKPPMIYWVQMLIGRTRGAFGATPFADETELRLTVALGGLLGVLATYFAARRMLRDRFDARLGDDAAWLSALGLASGVLYVRSSRIGELDVLTVPFVVVAVAALAHAWRIWKEERRTLWGAVALATLMATGAALTKGPPAILVVALAGYLPMLLTEPRAPATGGLSRGRTREALVASIGFVLTVIPAWLLAPRVNFPMDWLGLLFFGAVGAMLAVGAVRLADRERVGEWSAALARTHPALVLGLPLLAVWVWGRMVASQIGSEAVATLASAEVEDNLRVLVLDSPAKNIGFMLYGLAPTSIAMIAGVVWMLRDRPRLSEEQRVPFLWCGACLIAFSALGKGVARYLTPVWPGVAMLGGLWLAQALREWDKRLGHQRARYAVITLFIASLLVQAWWYGAGRQIHYGDRSPREFMRELVPKIEGGAMTTWKLDEPAMDYYAGLRLPRFVEPSELIRRADEAGPIVVIGRASQASEWVAAAHDAGLTVKGIEVRAKFSWRADGERVGAWRVGR
jgi:4-amino-4-deoxy-L-arabinose transferase-like glycosyltransferase